jgi:hypothetical protein
VALADGTAIDLEPLAREICGRYREEFPDERDRYGDAGDAWCRHDNRHLLNWAALSLSGFVDFEEKVGWLAQVLEARGFPLARLARNLELAAGVVEAELGAGRGDLAAALAEGARLVNATPSFLPK